MLCEVKTSVLQTNEVKWIASHRVLLQQRLYTTNHCFKCSNNFCRVFLCGRFCDVMVKAESCGAWTLHSKTVFALGWCRMWYHFVQVPAVPSVSISHEVSFAGSDPQTDGPLKNHRPWLLARRETRQDTPVVTNTSNQD